MLIVCGMSLSASLAAAAEKAAEPAPAKAAEPAPGKAPEKAAEPPKPTPEQAAQIAALCKQLGEGQYGSQGACQQLIAIGPAAMPALLKALKDPRPPARWWAAAAVSNLATDEGYAAILDVLRTEAHSFVRSTAVYYLRHFRTKARKDIWPVVEEMLADKDPEVARWALRLMVEDSAPAVQGGYAKLDDTLRKILASGSSELRAYALNHVREWAETDPQKARAWLPLVRPLVETADPRVRYDAIHTTLVLLDKGQLDFLRQAYEKDKDPLVREGILRCVTVIPEPPVEAIELFILGLDADDAKVRETAAKLLAKGCKQYFPYDPQGEADQRQAGVEKWTQWYQANRAKLQWEPDLRKFLLPGERPPNPLAPKTKAKGKDVK